MKPAPLLVFLPLLFPVCSLAARPLAKPDLRADGRYELKDRGRPMAFRIARDELLETTNGVVRRIPVTARAHVRQMQQAAKQLSGGNRKVDLIAYPEGKPETDLYRRLVTAKVAVTLDEGIDPTSIGLAAQAKGMTAVVFLPGDYVLEFADASEALTSAEALKAVPGVLKAEVLLGSKVLPAYIPNDPLFAAGTSSFNTFIGIDYAEAPVILGNPPPIYIPQGGTRAYQWYLNPIASLPQLPPVYFSNWKANDLPMLIDPDDLSIFPFELVRTPARPPTANGEVDLPTYFEKPAHLNVIDAWDQLNRSNQPITGANVKVGIIDDGVQLNHEDFNNLNILINDDRNFLDGDQSSSSVDPRRLDPTPPPGAAFSHGTNSAGLILARRDNAKGISGIAPEAKMAAYRLTGPFVDPAIFADALAWDAKRALPQINPDNPFGLPTGNEWRTGGIKFDIANNGWTYNTAGSDLIDMDLYLKKAIAYGATEGRSVEGLARGVIYVVPAGNDGDNHGDTNYSGQTNSLYTVTVGAVSDLSRRVSYSAPGASLRVVAPSNGMEMAPRITVGGNLKPAVYPPVRPDTLIARALGYTLTPDEWDNPPADRRNTQKVVTLNNAAAANQAPGYYNNFGGTSAACAMVSGVVALMLEANPKLGWRDVQEILMRSATVVDPMMGEWSYNALGMPMSHKYGAGLVNADRAVRMAKVWKNLGGRFGPVGNLVGTLPYKEVKGESRRPAANVLIGDNRQPVQIMVEPPSPGLRVEHVVVRLKVTHGRRGDLGIVLSSPKSGQADVAMESFLLVPHREDYNANIGMPAEPNGGTDRDIAEGEYVDFMTVRHWGTTATQNQPLGADIPNNNGQWTLTFWDNTSKGAVTSPNFAAPNPEDRVFVPVANPTTPARVNYVEVIYHGTNTPTDNESPDITTNSLVGKTGSPFQANIRAITDLTVNPTDNSERAPITDYRVRVLSTLTGNTELVIAPTTAAEYLVRFPVAEEEDTLSAHLRFDRTTGLLTNAPYLTDGLPFRPLPRGSWLLEVAVTNVFGTTRRQIPLSIRDTLNYQEFRVLYFTPEELMDPLISGDRADPDFDGIPNLLEYGMGGLPRVAEPLLVPVTTFDQSNLVYTYQVDTSIRGYDVTPQVSSLLDPIGSYTDLTPTVVSTDGNLQLRRVTVPIVPGTRQFVRLRIVPSS